VAGLRVAHDIPGRLRLRLSRGAPGRTLETALAGRPGVVGCTWTQHTGSLLVHYRPDAVSAAALCERVAAEVGASWPGEAPHPAAPPPAPVGLTGAVRDTVAALDTGVARATGGLLDLRSLLPLVLAAWAIREIARGAAGPLAWSTALWYAHGLFRDYNLPGGHA
jgi:hypothetical protein